MIAEFELYHGAAIRELIVGACVPVKIESYDNLGRVNTYKINGELGLHIKHSSKRLPPWQFTYSIDNLNEIRELAAHCSSVWLVHICWQAGIVALSLSEFLTINPPDAETTNFVRVDRDRNKMYRVNGTKGRLTHPKRRGLQDVFVQMQGEK